MRQFFDAAAEVSPCIVFIDELDSVGDRGRPHDHNSSWTDSIVGGLLECLDGFETTPGIVVMGATNHPAKIDAALRRPGRFDQTLSRCGPGRADRDRDRDVRRRNCRNGP
jgi:SpoVK/Ycf46/Vps4 family AAA+-type ATPase